jgi:hypothetical protein
VGMESEETWVLCVYGVSGNTTHKTSDRPSSSLHNKITSIGNDREQQRRRRER